MPTKRRWMTMRRSQAVASVGLAVTLGSLLLACSTLGTRSDAAGPLGGTGQLSSATQTSEEGQVTIAATWEGPTFGPVFRVVMDTHSVDLDGYDLRDLASLRTDQGGEVRPSEWDAPKGGHHRSGTLTFPATAPDGSPLIGPTTRTIEMIIRDVASVPERIFRWTL